MALTCIHPGKLCDGCGACFEKKYREDWREEYWEENRDE